MANYRDTDPSEAQIGHTSHSAAIDSLKCFGCGQIYFDRREEIYACWRLGGQQAEKSLEVVQEVLININTKIALSDWRLGAAINIRTK